MTEESNLCRTDTSLRGRIRQCIGLMIISGFCVAYGIGGVIDLCVYAKHKQS